MDIFERIQEENIRRHETKESIAHWEVVKEFEIVEQEAKASWPRSRGKKSGRKIDTGCTST